MNALHGQAYSYITELTTAQGLLAVPRSRLKIKGAWLHPFEVVAPTLCKSLPQELISLDT